MDTIDYLCDSLNNTKFALLSNRITKKDIEPEILAIRMGFVFSEKLDLFDRENRKICQILLPPQNIGQSTIKNQIFVKENLQFTITKIYI